MVSGMKGKQAQQNAGRAWQPGTGTGDRPARSNAGGDPAKGRSKSGGQEMPTGGLRAGIAQLNKDHAMSPAGKRDGKTVG